MKGLLLLSVALLGAILTNAEGELKMKCTGLLQNTCPKGYTRHYSGPNMLHATCMCERPKTEEEKKSDGLYNCESYAESCIRGNTHFCGELQKYECENKVYVDLCNKTDIFSKYFCQTKQIDYAKELNREGFTDDQLKQCQNYKTSCLDGNSDDCTKVPSDCDPETIKELCDKDKVEDEDKCASVTELIESRMPQGELVLSPEEEKDMHCQASVKECKAGKLAECRRVPPNCGREITKELCESKVITSQTICALVNVTIYS